MTRVVITGLGAITPLGVGVDRTWQGLIEGKSGVRKVTSFDATGLPSQIGGEVRDFDPSDYLERKEARRMDRFAQFAVAATKMALEDADYTIDESNAYRTGVIIGAGIGGIHTIEEQSSIYHHRGPNRISPLFIPMIIADMASGQVSILTGAKGPNSSSVTACASGANAIADSYGLIGRGAADVMICGGSEAAITGMAYAGFCAAGTLSTRNDEPEKASRPFDAGRDGFVMGEGAGILILESLDHARARGARIYAEIVGAGLTADGYHITAPHPEGLGAGMAMTAAMREAGIEPEEVDYINAHGTSTALNDKTETLAIKRAMGDYAYKVPISSTKSMIGHLLGAAGGVEAVVSVLTIVHGIIPPTINYETPDPDCDLDYVPNKARKAEVNMALSNSFGFGGHNVCLAFKRYVEG